MNEELIKTMLKDEATRIQALDMLGEWMKNTCLLLGATPSTAYAVSFILVEGIAASYESRKPDVRIVR